MGAAHAARLAFYGFRAEAKISQEEQLATDTDYCDYVRDGSTTLGV